MKLKSVLMMILLALTIIPITFVSLLLYKSGFELSKESYRRNLVESLNVQSDYISQAIEGNMIADYRFARRGVAAASGKSDLFAEFTAYLNAAEDKIAVCVLLDSRDTAVYAIGEKEMVDTVCGQLAALPEATGQSIQEFQWKDGSYSLGIVTPVWEQNAYSGSLVSVYDKTYLFKIISSYHEIADSSTYICRENGDIISARSTPNEERTAVETVLREQIFSDEGMIEEQPGGLALTGYYKNIRNTPWYLSGFVDNERVYSFTNQFLMAYILVLLLVLVVDLLLGFYCSHRVVEPINNLIHIIERYQNDLSSNQLTSGEVRGYVETTYLQDKFLALMKKIQLTQHNFTGIYQLYESSDMGDTNIDIDVVGQTISSNKDIFQRLMDEVTIPAGACVVENFTHCFGEKDQKHLMRLFEQMRDEHLAAMKEAEIYTPYLDGKWYHTLIVPMYENDRLSRLFIQLRDISGLKKQGLESSEQAKRDPLTGLNNRTGFTTCVNRVLQDGDERSVHGLLFIDMNYFKLVNDNFGHNAGDDLLRTVANTLLEIMRPEDIVSRFGGDEFAVFLSNTTEDAIFKVAKRLEESLVYPFRTDQMSFVVSVSIGSSIWRQDSSQTLEQILQQADVAMYQSKREFKQRATP